MREERAAAAAQPQLTLEQQPVSAAAEEKSDEEETTVLFPGLPNPDATLVGSLVDGLAMSVDNMPGVGAETKAQFALVRRLGVGLAYAQPTSNAPWDIGIKTEDGESVEILEMKVGLSQTRDLPRYVSGLVANASSALRWLFKAKDMSVLCGSDWAPVQDARPDGLRMLALAHGAWSLISIETIAGTFGGDRGFARNVLRHHSTDKAYTCFYAVTAGPSVVVTQADTGIVVVKAAAADGSISVDEYAGAAKDGGGFQLGPRTATFPTPEAFEERTELLIKGVKPTFAMLGINALHMFLNVSAGSAVFAARDDDDDAAFAAGLVGKLKEHARNASPEKNFLVDAKIFDEFDVAGTLEAFAEPTTSDAALRNKRDDVLTAFTKMDGTHGVWPGADLRGRACVEESLRAAAAHYKDIDFDIADPVGSEAHFIHAQTYAKYLKLPARRGAERHAVFQGRMGSRIAEHDGHVVEVPLARVANGTIDAETLRAKVKTPMVGYEKTDCDYVIEEMDVSPAISTGDGGSAYSAWHPRFIETMSKCSKDVAIGMLVRLQLVDAFKKAGMTLELNPVHASGGFAGYVVARVGVEQREIRVAAEIKVGLDAFNNKAGDAFYVPKNVAIVGDAAVVEHADPGDHARHLVRIYVAGPWAPFSLRAVRADILGLVADGSGSVAVRRATGKVEVTQLMMGQPPLAFALARAQRVAGGDSAPHTPLPYVDVRNSNAPGVLRRAVETAVVFALGAAASDVLEPSLQVESRATAAASGAEPDQKRQRTEPEAEARASLTRVIELRAAMVQASSGHALVYRGLESFDAELRASSVVGLGVLRPQKLKASTAVSNLDFKFEIAESIRGRSSKYKYKPAFGRFPTQTLQSVLQANGNDIFQLVFPKKRTCVSIDDLDNDVKVRAAGGEPGLAARMIREAAQVAIATGANIVFDDPRKVAWLNDE